MVNIDYFSLRCEQGKMPTLVTFIRFPSQCNYAKVDIQSVKDWKELKLSLFTDDNIST